MSNKTDERRKANREYYDSLFRKRVVRAWTGSKVKPEIGKFCEAFGITEEQLRAFITQSGIESEDAVRKAGERIKAAATDEKLCRKIAMEANDIAEASAGFEANRHVKYAGSERRGRYEYLKFRVLLLVTSLDMTQTNEAHLEEVERMLENGRRITC